MLFKKIHFLKRENLFSLTRRCMKCKQCMKSLTKWCFLFVCKNSTCERQNTKRRLLILNCMCFHIVKCLLNILHARIGEKKAIPQSLNATPRQRKKYYFVKTI